MNRMLLSQRVETAMGAGKVLRNFTLACAAFGSLTITGTASAASVLAWDFNGESNQVTSTADVFNANLDSSNLLTRGATAAASAGGNSFRTVGFSNNGIATANTDYFQFTLSANTGYALSLSSIDARFAGTASYRAVPGVSAQFAYSLDGTNFTLIGSPFSLTADTAMPQISLTGISALQNVAAATIVTFRYYATGQTTTGGWGFTSPTAGQYGLDIGGSLALAGGSTVSIGASGNTTFTPSSFGGAVFTNLDVAKFDSGAGTVALSGTVTAAGLIFTTDAYTLSSPTGSDTIAAPTVQVDAPTATISGKITGANPLSKLGAGTLVLSNAGNDFVGAVTVSAGTLQIGADGNLGNVANDLTLSGGTLKPTTSISLSATRDLGGSGTLDVTGGDTLTFNGTTNASLTLANTGTVALNGASNTITPTFTAAGTLSVTSATPAAILSVTTSNSTGTATISGPITLAGTNRTFSVADGSAATDLLVNGTVTSTTGRISKIGAGTLELTGNNSGMAGIQLGIQGASPIAGGRILFNSANALGNQVNQIQANYGTLQATTPITSTAGLSIGGRTTGFLTFAGSNMTFGGSTSSQSFFRATGTTGELRFNVDNTTTLAGTFAATSGGGAASGITVGGAGTLVIGSDASAITEKWTTTDSLTFNVASAGKIGAGGIGLSAGTTLVMDISSISLFASSTGALVGTGGALSFNINTTDFGSYPVFASGSGTFSTIGISGLTYGNVSLTDGDADQIWTGNGVGASFSFNVTTGTLIVAVPEPREYALAIAGLLGAVIVLRRRQAARIA